jgi:hypothetical protein
LDCANIEGKLVGEVVVGGVQSDNTSHALQKQAASV